MKCKMCYSKTDYDNSIGRDNFIICNSCADELSRRFHIEPVKVLGLILAIGFKREEKSA